MRLTNAFIANYAEIRGGLAYVAGAFPEWFDAPTLPIIGSLYAVIVFDLEPNDLGTLTEIRISVVRPGGQTDPITVAKTQAMRLPDAPPLEGAPIHQVYALPIPTQFGSEGLHEYLIEFQGTGIEPARIGIGVRRVQQATPQAFSFQTP